MGQSATDRAYEWLHSAILTGTLPSGTFVDETSVANAAGVSRTPVREAFQRLAGERIIQLVPRRGAQVRDLTVGDLVDTFAARFVLESAAIRHVIAHRIDVAGEMAPLLEQMEKLNSERSVSLQTSEYVALDKEFHRRYVVAQNNTVLLSFYDTLWPLHEWNVIRARTTRRDFIAMITDQHRAIFDALVAGDASRAIETLEEHLRPFNG